MRRWRGWTLILTISITIFVIWQYPDENLHIVMCDVGQGDSTLMFRSFFQVVVDGGPDERVLACLGEFLPFWDRQIEVLVMTHPQADHMNGLAAILKRYEVGMLVANGLSSDSEAFSSILDEVRNKGIKVYVPKQGERLKGGGIEFEILWPIERVGTSRDWEKGNLIDQNMSDELIVEDPNEVSVVLEVNYGEVEALLTGDIGEKEEQALVDSRVLKRVEILKVPHHGSKTSSTLDFLEEIRPSIALISSGKDNNFGHPSPEVVERLEKLGVKIFRTDEVGSVEIVSDGVKYWIAE